jgi:hypothetical protein
MFPFSKAPLGPKGDFDRLFAVSGHRGATLGILGEVDNPEPVLGGHQAVSRPVHLGSQHLRRLTA